MVENHLEHIQAEFALNEGGKIHLVEDDSTDRVYISTAEKVPWRGIRLEAGGDYAHNGGRRWTSQDDPEWQMLAAWVRGERTGDDCTL